MENINATTPTTGIGRKSIAIIAQTHTHGRISTTSFATAKQLRFSFDAIAKELWVVGYTSTTGVEYAASAYKYAV